MAETAILAAVKILGSPLVNEALKFAISKFSELAELDSGIRNIRDELVVMQTYINGINTRNNNNKAFEEWLNQVQNLAYRVEDIVDEFIHLVGHKKYGGIMSNVKLILKPKSSLKETMSLGSMIRIVSQLKEAEKSLKNLAARKDQWVSILKNTKHLNNPSYYSNESPQCAAVANFIEEDKLVGIEKNRERLISWLYSNKLNLSIISIWGRNGLGKTTLLTNIFETEKKKFNCHAWVSISETCNVYEILENLISNILERQRKAPIHTTNTSLKELKEILRDILKEKSYLIILDDVGNAKSFRDIQDAFIDNHKGSRIVIIGRNENVASLAPEEHRLRLEPLKEDESWELFCINAFLIEPRQPPLESAPCHECPPNLENWARKIVSMCEGLPLALVSVGGMLSLHEKNEFEWKRVHDQLNWELDHNEEYDHRTTVLDLSFNDLSKQLQNCFLYCCMFPEEHLIARKKLIRLWIAEGFIKERGSSTLEEVAEGYLVELVRRSMLQLVKKNTFGRIKRCRMQDTWREFAISLCRKENFGFLHGDEVNFGLFVDTIPRRLSAIKSSSELSFSKNLSRLRTFLSFDCSMLLCHLLSLTLLHSMYLSVLDLEGLPIETLPETIGDLFNLRYLSLRRTKVKYLPKSIERIRNLQTLDLVFSDIEKLPGCITKFMKLRHLFAEIEIDSKYLSFRSHIGIDIPSAVFEFKDMQTLQALEANAEVVKKLGNLNQLRSFRILNVKESYCPDLCRELSKMLFLSFLDINASSENEFLQLEHLYSPPPKLQKLNLTGQLKETIFQSPLFQISGKKLQTLYLSWSRLQNDPLPSLSCLSSLTRLHLNKAYDGQRLVFRARWFPKLKVLILKQLFSLIEVEMEKGTMMSLERINLRYMKQLEEIPKGMEQIKSLKLVYCQALSCNFWGSKKEGTYQIEHFKCRIC